MTDDELSPADFFEVRGFKVRIEERDLHAEHMAHGEPGRASFFVEGRRYFVVDLLASDGSTLQGGYGVAETEDEALREAQRKFESEQA